MIIDDLFNNKKSNLSEGMKARDLSMYCEKLVAEKGWDAAYKHARFMAQGGTDPAWGSVLKYLQSMKDGVAEGFQDNHPEYGGKDPNKTLFYDRNLGDYQGEPWSDVSDNWSGDKPEAAPSVSKNPTITLRDNLTGKVKEYDINSPEAQEVIANQKQQTINSPTYKAVVDAFKNVKPAPPGNLATITSDNDWQDARLGRYDVNFPDKFRAGQSTITKPSPNFDPQNIVQVEPKPPLVWPPVDKEKSTAADPEKADNSGKDMRWDPVKARMVPVETEPQVKTVPTSQSLADKEKEIPSSNSTFYTYKSPEQKSAKLSSRAAVASKDLPSAAPKPGSWQELAKLNNITDPRKLQAGTRINTPDGGSIYVNKGDTLSGIAQKMRGVREGMAEGKRPDTYHIVNKDGKPASLASYADKESAVKDRDAKHQGAEVRQLGPRGKVKGVSEAHDAAAKEIHGNLFHDSIPPGAEKHHVSAVLKAHGLKDTDAKDVINRVRKMGYTGPRLDKSEVSEVSLGDYRKKAAVSKATSQMDRFFGRDDPATVARADQTIAKRERGMARADARVRPYTPPTHDAEKHQRDLTTKYPNIDELVRKAELRRDPNYEYADGQAYYNGREAEHNYQRLKQIQRVIQGLNEMDFGDVNQTTDSATGDVTTSFNQGPISVSQTKTPGGYTKQTDQQFKLGTATMGVKTAGPDIGAGQLAGTTTATATNNQTGQAKQQVRGVGFGGATGPNVGKNYVGASNDELAKHAADSFMGANENIDRMKHLAGIKPVR